MRQLCAAGQLKVAEPGLQTINWDYFICEFTYNDNINRDIFERDTIRLANPNPTNKISDFFICKSAGLILESMVKSSVRQFSELTVCN